MTSLRTELNWGMLEKAAAELPDSLSAEGASTPKPPRLLERPGVTGAAAAAATAAGAGLKRLGETHYNAVTKLPDRWPTYDHRGRAHYEPGQSVRVQRPYRPWSGMPNGLFGRQWQRAYRLDQLRTALSAEPRTGRLLGMTPKYPKGLPGPRARVSPIYSYKPGRLSGLPSGLKGLGAGLGALSLYNLLRPSESD